LSQLLIKIVEISLFLESDDELIQTIIGTAVAIQMNWLNVKTYL